MKTIPDTRSIEAIICGGCGVEYDPMADLHYCPEEELYIGEAEHWFFESLNKLDK